MQYTDDSGDMALSEEEAKIKKEAVAWVIRLQNGDISQEDRRAFETWQAQSPRHAFIYRKVYRVWESPELSAAAIVAARGGPTRFEATPTRSLRWLALACLLLIGILADHFDVITRWQSDYRTGTGERRTVELPDRSIATLNTHSAIALFFDDGVRRVRLLKGEVFFHIQQDADRPFIVESAETAIRAVGTAFVVRTDSGKDRITVLEGVVEVDSKSKAASPIAVMAGSQIQTEQGFLGRPQTVDVATASSWMRGRLAVQDVPFAQVLEELRRYYPGTIVLWNTEIGEMNITGTYNIDDPQAALALLLQTVPVSMTRLTDHLVILF